MAIRVADDGRSMTVDATLGRTAVRPKEIRVRLRSGDGSPLVSATVNGVATPIQPGDTIVLPSNTQDRIQIVAWFQ